MKKLFLVFSILTASITVMGQQPIPVKPRILISTDIVAQIRTTINQWHTSLCTVRCSKQKD